jgi:hypothetical protein
MDIFFLQKNLRKERMSKYYSWSLGVRGLSPYGRFWCQINLELQSWSTHFKASPKINLLSRGLFGWNFEFLPLQKIRPALGEQIAKNKRISCILVALIQALPEIWY